MIWELGHLILIDGELIILDGKAYQAKGSEGKAEVVEVSDDVKVPYAAVVPHQAEVIFKQRFAMTDKELEKRIESYYDGVNLFRSIKIKGTFAKMHVRMIPKSAPDIKFADVATHQPEYTRENISVRLLGSGHHKCSMALARQVIICISFLMISHLVVILWTLSFQKVWLKLGQLTNSTNVSQSKTANTFFAKFNMDELKEDITKSE